MNTITIIFIAFGLAMDAFAVALASGIALKANKAYNAFKMALFFGVFQMVMPILGWLGGTGFRNFISSFDHYIAFGLLMFVGCKMIYESMKIKDVEEKTNPFNAKVLFILAVATSIDAFAIGLTFAFLKVAIVTPVIVIGIVTFAVSFAGVFIGNKIGHFFERRIEVVGGLILIVIGVKILIEHL